MKTKNNDDLTFDKLCSELTIKLDSEISENTDGAQMYKYNDIEFYVFHDSNIVWWEYNKDFYSFVCGFDIVEYEDKVIENIK